MIHIYDQYDNEKNRENQVYSSDIADLCGKLQRKYAANGNGVYFRYYLQRYALFRLLKFGIRRYVCWNTGSGTKNECYNTRE